MEKTLRACELAAGRMSVDKAVQCLGEKLSYAESSTVCALVANLDGDNATAFLARLTW